MTGRQVSSRTDHAQALADTVTGFCEHRFAEVGAVAALAIGTLGAPGPRRTDLAIESHVRALLGTTDPPLAGAGLVVAPHVLVDDPYWLEWWLAGPDGAPAEARRLTADLNPQSVTFRDYTALAWFEEPRRTGERAITGPYVDYLCTDQYTLTFTAPVSDGSRFLGVAGVDVLARWFERHLLAAVDAQGPVDDDCLVVNRAGRVVASFDDDWVTGDLVRELGGAEAPDDWSLVACAGTPFAVARRRRA